MRLFDGTGGGRLRRILGSGARWRSPAFTHRRVRGVELPLRNRLSLRLTRCSTHDCRQIRANSGRLNATSWPQESGNRFTPPFLTAWGLDWDLVDEMTCTQTSVSLAEWCAIRGPKLKTI